MNVAEKSTSSSVPSEARKELQAQGPVKVHPNIDSVIFDLDGVITRTASLHSNAWKGMFDAFLTEEMNSDLTASAEKYCPFTHEHDYLRYVDGKPRYQGVESFLNSRGITIPYGTPADPPTSRTICGLGNKKNEVFNEILERDGVEVFDSTVEFAKQLKASGIRIGVASSSKNCAQILRKTGLDELFETCIDGVVSVDRGLKGKPHPDIFLTACAELNSSPARSVVVEDADSGVLAGQRGRFGLVLGIAREHNASQLRSQGADIVISDMEEFSLPLMVSWFTEGIATDSWRITYADFNDKIERSRESLLTVGNGFFGTRGALEECDDNGKCYPGTYVAGLYNRLESKVGDRMTTNEDFVNAPNWISVRFRAVPSITAANNTTAWIDPSNCEDLEIERWLDLKEGTLRKTMIVTDENNGKYRVLSSRCVSMAQPHLAALQYSITPLTSDTIIEIESRLDGSKFNNGVPRYRELCSQHLLPSKIDVDGDYLYLSTRTNQSQIEIVEVAHHRVTLNDFVNNAEPGSEAEAVPVTWNQVLYANQAATSARVSVKKGQTLTLEKFVGLATSKESSSPEDAAISASKACSTFSDLHLAHRKAWNALWEKVDVKVDGDRFAQKILRLHAYHLLATASPLSGNLDAAIPARGLHGEAYRGHIFWDEIFILPWYNLYFPEVTRACTRYRINRLDAARQYAKEHSYRGAMFPWQSGSEGIEETPTVHINPISGKWGPDYSSFQRHVSLAIAFNLWMYGEMTGDTSFMEQEGTELFFEICRFWVSRAEFSSSTNRYHIRNVMGPNEFHEHAKNCPGGGLIDNGYTNMMTAWLLEAGVGLFHSITNSSQDSSTAREVIARLGITPEEVHLWHTISNTLNLVIKDGVISQFEGFFDLLPLNFDEYRARYGNISRMDRVLKSENKTPDHYQVSKQADTLMAFYVLGLKKVEDILMQLGYGEFVDSGLLRRNYEYYLPRTSHGSTLSKIVHADLAQFMGEEGLSFDLYTEALYSDYKDVQGGTTGEGIHTGVMAASLWVALTRFAGVDFSGEILAIQPLLPKQWNSISGSFTYKGNAIWYTVSKESVTLKVVSKDGNPYPVRVGGSVIQCIPGEPTTCGYELAHSLTYGEEVEAA
jgi:beta-phosphoglucomutase family hydrolase